MTQEATIILTILHGVATETRAQKAANECTRAFRKAYEDAMREGGSPTQATMLRARLQADKAFELAMPPLDTRANIRAYITAIGRGLQLRVFTPRHGQQLLYMAQVALSAQGGKKARR